MGKLRLEPKKQAMSAERYEEVRNTLREAVKAAGESNIFWDLEPKEDAGKTRRDFMAVAEKENIPLVIRRPRGAKCLELKFDKEVSGGPKRISANESRNRILSVLEDAAGPLSKSEIVSASGISSSTWNARIKELLKEGKVSREGTLRDSTYTLA